MPNPAVPRVCQDAHKQPRWERRGETNETADLEIYVRSRRTETLKKLAKRIYTPAVGGSIPSAPTITIACQARVLASRRVTVRIVGR